MESFEALEDPRRRLASCDYPLQELLLTALCAISSGADDWVDVGLWGREKLDWLRRFLAFENGIASHDTFSRVFALLDAKSFEACFIAWMERHAIHIDGKSLRGSHNGCEAMAHLVSAWDSAAGVTLGQIKTANKSNEITAWFKSRASLPGNAATCNGTPMRMAQGKDSCVVRRETGKE